MSTLQELQNRLSAAEARLGPLQERETALEAEYQTLKNQALSANFKLPEQYNDFLAARARASAALKTAQEAVSDRSDVELEIRNIKTEINAASDQGPKTVSAGQTQQEAEQARDDKATSQAPPAAGETQNNEGNTVTTPNTTTATNAESSEPSEPTVSAAPPSLPAGTNADAAAEDPAAAQGTGTQLSARDVLQVFEKQSDATFSYIYRAKEVVSIFNQGRFTQEIVGSLIPFNTIIKPGLPAAASAAEPTTGNTTAQQAIDARNTPDQSDAETRRLAAAATTARTRGGNFAQRQQDAGITLREARAGRAFTTNPATETRNFERIYGLQPSSPGPLAAAETAPATSNGQSVAVNTAPDTTAANPRSAQLIKKD